LRQKICITLRAGAACGGEARAVHRLSTDDAAARVGARNSRVAAERSGETQTHADPGADLHSVHGGAGGEAA